MFCELCDHILVIAILANLFNPFYTLPLSPSVDEDVSRRNIAEIEDKDLLAHIHLH